MIGVDILSNISDIIEQYIKDILLSGQAGYVEIQRNDLADRFRCVPSQINYVISTRFTVERGYIVESKRGGGGYIRIRKMDLDKGGNVYQTVLRLIGRQISFREAEDVIQRLLEERLITQREARMLLAAVDGDLLQMAASERDRFRAQLLSVLLMAILKG
ncbi:CtsR family transcriptional regulator [Effusibacillus dendaii]|uniref:Transcriptional regulator CtsR n=1 Tax=Effusibacillus dendaii TaxID=2743772 RepID=A0A7I8DHR4_9BACL|nr:CtsR family transcriptional regulator [Effusibacillus dendaii]